MTISELIQAAHADAKAKGLWDEERNTGELLMLIVSECGEALEAHRSGKRADLQSYSVLRSFQGIGEASGTMEETFQEYIKDTFEDELADIVIRIADLCGREAIALEQEPNPWTMEYFRPKNIGELLLLTCADITDLYRMKNNEAVKQSSIQRAFGMPFLIAKLEGVDLWRHIELKLAYNRTRPRKHGKSY